MYDNGHQNGGTAVRSAELRVSAIIRLRDTGKQKLE